MKNLKSFLLPFFLVAGLSVGYAVYMKAAYNWFSGFSFSQDSNNGKTDLPTGETIQLALLLDTSNSMDGLIEQAKSQLWKIVGELNLATRNGETPNLQIALYEYGNSGLSLNDGFIRQITPFTRDMDLISKNLFSLRTDGGDEFCGQVIRTSIENLDWSAAPNNLRLIYIAGNESFAQGTFPYAAACNLAKNKDIIVNTIFCGPEQEGLRLNWKEGANLTGGNFMTIDHNQKTVYHDTPYDNRISELNKNLNDTYIPYGKDGAEFQQNQKVQDSNANSYSKSNEVSRAIFKCSKNYSNEKWDLLDAFTKDKSIVKQTAKLPEQYRGKDVAAIEAELESKLKEREAIKAEVNSLNEERRAHIKKIEATQTDTLSLDKSIVKAVKKQAKQKGYSFKN